MRFTCNGTITKWIYGAKASDKTAELQIWRKATNGYRKVNSIAVNADPSNGTNVYESNSNQEFQEGDVFGIHIPKMVKLLYQLTDSERRNQYLRTMNALTSISTGSLTSDNGFPLVTAEISKFIFYYM